MSDEQDLKLIALYTGSTSGSLYDKIVAILRPHFPLPKNKTRAYKKIMSVLYNHSKNEVQRRYSNKYNIKYKIRNMADLKDTILQSVYPAYMVSSGGRLPKLDISQAGSARVATLILECRTLANAQEAHTLFNVLRTNRAFVDLPTENGIENASHQQICSHMSWNIVLWTAIKEKEDLGAIEKLIADHNTAMNAIRLARDAENSAVADRNAWLANQGVFYDDLLEKVDADAPPTHIKDADLPNPKWPIDENITDVARLPV